MKKLYLRDYHLTIKEVGDHLEIHIAPLDIAVETEPGKTAYTDALDAAQAAIERIVLQHEYEQEHVKTVAQ